jgi:steroid 5-alpha reductase family enzyme
MTLLLIIVLIGCSLLMLVAWRVQQSSGNSSWVDVAWTFGTGAGRSWSR